MDWQKIKAKDLDVAYTDVMKPSSRSYGAPAEKHVCSEKDARLQPDPGPLTFIKYFALVFLPAFSLLGYFFCPPPVKWAVIIAGPLLGGFTFAMIYFLIKHEVDAGPYIIYDKATDKILLPRFGKSFQRTAVTLQWITGRDKGDPEIQTDLNLIVEENGNLNRYFVMGGPIRKQVRNFVEEADIPVIEINTRWRGRRDLDAQSKS